MRIICTKKTLRKIAAYVAVMAMIFSCIAYMAPVTSAAEEGEEPLVRLLTFSDFQNWYPNGKYDTDDSEHLYEQLTNILGATYDAGVDPDYWLYGGDFTCLHTIEAELEGMRLVKDVTYGMWGNLNDDNSFILQGNHDESKPGEDGLAPTGPIELDDLIIYMISEDDFPTTQGSDEVRPIVEKTSDDLYDYLADLAYKEEHRPIIIASHGGLHYDIDRFDGNNQFAYILFDTIRDIADQLDIIFLFAHNHTNGDEMVGGSITFFPIGSELGVTHEDSITNKSGTYEPINFTYANYGYVGNIGDIYNNADASPFERDELTNLLVCSVFNIYKDRIVIERYSANGHEEKYDSVIERRFPFPDPTPEPAGSDSQTPNAGTNSGSPNPQNPGGAQNPGGQNPGGTQTSDGSKMAPAAGTTLYDDSSAGSYIVTSSSEVSYKGTTDAKAKTVKVPDTITAGGATYKVTEVGANAFSGNKNATKIVIGKNVKKIGKNAFAGCKKVKNLTILTPYLSAKSVAAKVFKTIPKNAKVYVVKNKLKAYKKLFKSKGLNKKNKIKKV